MIKIIKNWIGTITLKWILICVIEYLLVVFISIFIFIRPQLNQYHEVVNKKAELIDIHVDLMGFNVKEAIDDIEIQIEELKELESIFQERLMKDKNINSIMPIINNYCSKLGFEISRLTPLDDIIPIPPKYKKQYIGVNLQGNYTNFLRLLLQFESNPEWLVIENLLITPTDTKSIVEFDFVIAVLQEKQAA